MYFAVTSENPRMMGWAILAEAPTRAEAEREGSGAAWNDTTRCNLRVGSRTALRRRLRIPARRWEMMLEAWDNNQASSDAHAECDAAPEALVNKLGASQCEVAP